MKLSNSIRETILSVIFARIKMLRLNGVEINRPTLDQVVKTELLVSSLDYDQEDYDIIIRDVEYHEQIKHSPSAVIYGNYDEDDHDWYSKLDNSDGEFWKLYRRFLEENNSLDSNSLNKLDYETLPNLMNCLNNPNNPVPKKDLRLGLVIGDVQSGKTATYAGLICKAADAGYKVVVLLTGITETLRQQTQERMDEGVIGYSVRYTDVGGKKTLPQKAVGVGLYARTKVASAFTSYQFDFKQQSSQTISTSLKSHNSLVIFVVKKNVKILENLYDWLVALNKDVLDDMIHAPMLLIDDEADNASINTNGEYSDPTKTNAAIRKICNAFTISNYVGFTATPFANVFIEPDSTKDMLGLDLFPKDFIYVLPTPSSYIGAKKLFNPDHELYNKCLKFITDIVEPTSEELKTDPNPETRCLYYKHSKNWHGSFPKSLAEAIHCFYLANVIRDLRHDENKPRTMMINVSRFVKVHQYITEYVADKYREEKHTIFTDFDVDYSKNTKVKLWRELKECYDNHFSYCEFGPEQILDKENLKNAIKDIEVLSVNSRKDSAKLNYKRKPGPRYIAIGGLSLSRGLTLSGLMTSYFYRNTSTFDVLMQMGRWFGYRHGYEDICHIWTSHASADYYKDISDSTEELKDDIRRMREEKLKPKDFGIKVHDISEELNITSANKMRISYDHEEFFSFWGNLFETPYVNTNIENNKANLKTVHDFIVKLNTDKSLHFDQKENNGTILISDVSSIYIRGIISDLKISMKNPHFYKDEMIDFLEKTVDSKIDFWDVVIFAGRGNSYEISSGIKLNMINRSLKLVGNHVGFTGSAGRLGSKTDGLYALSEVDPQIIETAKCDYKNDKELSKIPSNSQCPSDVWFKYVSERKPCLMIYLVEPSDKSRTGETLMNNYLDGLNGDPVVGFGVGFPKNGSVNASSKKYKVNKVFFKQLIEEACEDEDDLL